MFKNSNMFDVGSVILFDGVNFYFFQADDDVAAGVVLSVGKLFSNVWDWR